MYQLSPASSAVIAVLTSLTASTEKMSEASLSYFQSRGLIQRLDAAQLSWSHAANSRSRLEQALSGQSMGQSSLQQLVSRVGGLRHLLYCPPEPPTGGQVLKSGQFPAENLFCKTHSFSTRVPLCLVLSFAVC